MWIDRKQLFMIDDGEGEQLFVVADSFKEAIDKFKTWDSEIDELDIRSVVTSGYLINELIPREK